MKLPKIAFILIAGSLALAACASSRVAAQAVPVGTPSANEQPTTPATVHLSRSDSQGNVTVEVKPENLGQPGDNLVFDVAMNTHMVDLSMDLAKLATLTTDQGETIQASQWDGPKGGHHVNGKLIFPSSANGKPVLDGASRITLTIKGVDAPTRVFTWQIIQ